MSKTSFQSWHLRVFSAYCARPGCVRRSRERRFSERRRGIASRRVLFATQSECEFTVRNAADGFRMIPLGPNGNPLLDSPCNPCILSARDSILRNHCISKQIFCVISLQIDLHFPVLDSLLPLRKFEVHCVSLSVSTENLSSTPKLYTPAAKTC